jgi:hypothetical protein
MSRLHLILTPGLLCDHAVWESQARDLHDIADVTIPDHGQLDSFEAMATAILRPAASRSRFSGKRRSVWRV